MSMVIHQPPPLVICDLDGVIMPILPYVIQSNGSIGDTDWMDKSYYKSVFREAFARDKRIFSTEHAFTPDHDLAPGDPFCPDHRDRDLIWSSELVGNFRQMMDDGQITWLWLSSNLPWISSINKAIGFDDTVAVGANCSVLKRGYKLDTVEQMLRRNLSSPYPTPIIWIDDQQASKANARLLKPLVQSTRTTMLMVQPDTRIGISREEWQRIEQFVTDPRERVPCQIKQIGNGEPGDGFATVRVKRRPSKKR